MLTSALVTRLKKEFPDWSRVSLLSFLNEIQLMVFTQGATNQMRMYDSSTGKDPLLTTTSGTYEYYINTTNGFSNNAWRIDKVYSEDINEPSDVLKFDGYYTTAGKVVFNSDPGSTTYYVRCYRLPNELTTESVQLEVPYSFHLSHVYRGTVGLIELSRSGKSDNWENFIQKLLPELKMKMCENNSSFNVEYKGY